MKYKIVMDSSSNLRAMEGVSFAGVPLKINTDQRECVDDENLEMDEMLAYLESYKGRSGTSCPNVGEWMEAFGEAQQVFAVAITSNLSGCYNALMQAKEVYEQSNPGRRVCALDSLSTGPEMELIGEKIQELAAQGKDFDTVEQEVREYMGKTHLLFSLESLNNLARNGRVSPLVAKAAGLLGIRVVGKASDVGTLQPLHKLRGEAKALTGILKEMVETGFAGGKVRIAHCKNLPAAQKLAQLVKEKFGSSDIRIGECGGLCSFYAERGGLLVGYEG